MIPSRPLRAGEIAHETLRLFGKSFGRILLLALLFFVPACILLNSGINHFVRTSIDVAVSAMGFNEQDLTEKRKQIREELRRSNPESFDQLYGEDSSNTKSATVTTSNDSVHSGNSASIKVDSISQDSTSHDSSYKTATHVEDDSLTISINDSVVSRFSVGELFSKHMPLLMGGIILSVVGWLLMFFSQSIVYAAACDQTCYAFEERKATLGEILRNLFTRNVWKTLALFFLVFISTSMAVEILAEIAYQVGDALGSLVYFIAQFARFYLIVRWCMAVPAAISEEIGIMDALKRSWHLTTFQIARVFGINALFLLGMFGLFILLSIPLSIVGGVTAMMWFMKFVGTDVMTIAEFSRGITDFILWLLIVVEVLFGLALLIAPVFNTVFYYDLRTRLDGPLSYENSRSS